MCDFGISGYLVDSVAKTMDAGCKPYMAVSSILFYKWKKCLALYFSRNSRNVWDQCYYSEVVSIWGPFYINSVYIASQGLVVFYIWKNYSLSNVKFVIVSSLSPQPERINPETNQKGYNVKSDIWSLGITMVGQLSKISNTWTVVRIQHHPHLLPNQLKLF